MAENLQIGILVNNALKERREGFKGVDFASQLRVVYDLDGMK